MLTPATVWTPPRHTHPSSGRSCGAMCSPRAAAALRASAESSGGGAGRPGINDGVLLASGTAPAAAGVAAGPDVDAAGGAAAGAASGLGGAGAALTDGSASSPYKSAYRSSASDMVVTGKKKAGRHGPETCRTLTHHPPPPPPPRGGCLATRRCYAAIGGPVRVRAQGTYGW